MPPDNAATVAPGADVEFPNDGGSGGGAVGRVGPSSFRLEEPGSYLVMFSVSVNQPGQLVLTLDGNELLPTATGRATGTSAITGFAVVTSTAPGAVLTVRNPSGNPTALTVTPSAGGTLAASAHLTVLKLN